MNKLSKDLDFIIKEAESSFEVMSNKSIFLTGGTGFFGKWLLESLIWANNFKKVNISITVLSRNPEKFQNNYPHLCEGVTFVKGDIESFKYPGQKFDYLIHAATEASAVLNKNDPAYMLNSIINGTRRVLDFAKYADVKRVLHTSSGAVYGSVPNDLQTISESYLGAPDTSNSSSAYGEGKRISELLGNIFATENNIDFLNARCFAFAGPYLPLDGTFAIGNFIKDALNGNNIIIKGDGRALRSYLYAADLVVWLLKILTHGSSGRSYNVGSDDAYSIYEVAKEVQKKKGIAVKILDQMVIGTSGSNYIPNVSRANSELFLKSNFKLPEIIDKMIEYYS